MIYAPIMIPTLNRYTHFKNCVESLAACTHADKTELVIGLDYPPADKYVEGWQKIKEYLPTIKGFLKVTVFEREKNYGAAGNAVALREYVQQKYDRYIFTEDDNIFAPCFLDYVNQALERYKDDEKIISICGYFPNERIDMDFSGNTVALIQGDTFAWGYGSWVSKRDKYRQLVVPNYRKAVFHHNIKTLQKMKYYYAFDHLLSWLDNRALDRPCDVTNTVSNILNDYYILVPNVSMVKNMGYDGTGINCGAMKNDVESKRVLTNVSSFNIIDNDLYGQFSMNEKYYIEYKNRELSKKSIRLIKRFIIRGFIFGYDYAMMIRMFRTSFVSFLKRIGLKK